MTDNTDTVYEGWHLGDTEITVGHDTYPLKKGDKLTISEQYKRRTLIEWLKRKPRELMVYRVVCDV